MKKLTRKLKLNKYIWAVAGVLVAVWLVNSFINYRVNKTYHSIIDNQAITAAFFKDDPSAIATASQRYGLDYQKVINKKLVYATNSHLPKLRILFYPPVSSSAVLLPNITTRLSQRLPYKLVFNHAVYAGVSVCALSCEKQMFVVYKRALP